MATEATARPQSDLSIPPGEFLEEEIAALGMTQQELAIRTGRPLQVINEIIKGKKAITEDTALELERVLNIPAHVWINLEGEYQLTKARSREQDELAGQEDWLKEFPLKDMEALKWIAKGTSRSEKVRALLKFFGVANFSAYQKTAYSRSAAMGFRITPGARAKVSDGALNAWLRKGELDGLNLDTRKYDPDRFRAAVEAIRQLTDKEPTSALQRMRELLAEAGVALILTPPLPKSAASGCARWLTKEKALIQLSARGLSDDKLWFDFFHEAGHVVKHEIRQVYVEGLNGESPAEDEANAFASDILIPPAAWAAFVQRADYSASSVKDFASGLGLIPGIVVGRMQHDHKITYATLNHLKTPLRWVHKEGE